MDYDLILSQVEEVKTLLGPDLRVTSVDQIFQYLEDAGELPDRVKIVTDRISASSKRTLVTPKDPASIDLTVSPSTAGPSHMTEASSIDLTLAPDTPITEPFQSSSTMMDQFNFHDASFSGPSESHTSCPILSSEKTSTTEADLTVSAKDECTKRKLSKTFDREDTHSKRFKLDESPVSHFFNDSTENDIDATEFDFITADVDLNDHSNQSDKEFDPDAFQTLRSVFPNTDPEFIKEKVQSKGPSMTEEDVNALISELLEITDHPSLADHSAKEIKQKEISRIVSMTVSDFLDEYEDPHSHFCNKKFETATDIYKQNAVYHLRQIFTTHKLEDVRKALDDSGHNFISAARKLEGMQISKGKHPLEPLSNPPKELDSRLLLELVYYKLAESIMECQRERKNNRRIKLDTARLLEEVVECENCHNDSLFNEVSSCPEGHLLCKSCLLAIARKEQSSPDLCCPGRLPGPGCGSVFPPAALRLLLPNRLINQLEFRRQPVCPSCKSLVILTGKADLAQCVACEQISCMLCKQRDHTPLKCGETQDQHVNTSDLSSKIINMVVDTCVLLDNLPLVKQITNNRQQGGLEPLVWIPWIVLQELDHIKDRRKNHGNLQWKARAAGKWINSCLLSQATNSVRGQSTEEEKLSSERFTAQCPDDKILQFCLYLKDNEAGQKNILLLTNDINLSSKALIHGICAVQHHGLLKKLNDVRNT